MIPLRVKLKGFLCYKEEQEAGLHAPGAKKKVARKPKATAKPPDEEQISFF